jgi:hypothetical protein
MAWENEELNELVLIRKCLESIATSLDRLTHPPLTMKDLEIPSIYKAANIVEVKRTDGS